VETIQPEVIPVEIPGMPEVEVDNTPVIAEAPQLVVAPLKGDVLTAFSMDTLVYNPTLDDWRTHDGIDISATPGATVRAASAGTVDSVADDVLMGTTIVISHRDGYHTTYANLQSKPAVKAGDSVTAGQIIGYVGNTGISTGAHLHFGISYAGTYVNPLAYIY
jgi:murein DD-endopeptidase MepM/ murein hydrolase activator NlpD